MRVVDQIAPREVAIVPAVEVAEDSLGPLTAFLPRRRKFINDSTANGRAFALIPSILNFALFAKFRVGMLSFALDILHLKGEGVPRHRFC
jgi:hypothetical protein